MPSTELSKAAVRQPVSWCELLNRFGPNESVEFFASECSHDTLGILPPSRLCPSKHSPGLRSFGHALMFSGTIASRAHQGCIRGISEKPREECQPMDASSMMA